MPSYRHHDFGNLYVQFNVQFPGKDDLRNINLLEQVLPPRLPQPQPSGDSMVEDFDLQEVDQGGQARAHGQGSAYEEDDEDGIPQGAERVQCASQ